MSKELLESYGYEGEVTAENIAEVQEFIRAKIREEALNDSEFLKGITEDKLNPEIKAKIITEGKLAIHHQAMREIDKTLTAEERALIGEDDRKDPIKYQKKAYSIVSSRVGDNKELLAQLQSDLAEAQKKSEEIEANYLAKLEEKESEFGLKLNNIAKEKLVSEVNLSLKDNVAGDINGLFDLVYSKLSNRFDIVPENGKIEVYQKGTKLKIPKVGKTGEFQNISDLLEGEYRLLQVWKEKSIDNKTPIMLDAGNPKFTNNEIEKARQAEAERKLKFQ